MMRLLPIALFLALSVCCLSQPFGSSSYRNEGDSQGCIKSINDLLSATATAEHQMNISAALFPSGCVGGSDIIRVSFVYEGTSSKSVWLWASTDVLAHTPSWRLALASLGSIYGYQQSSLTVSTPAFCSSVSRDQRHHILRSVVPFFQRRTLVSFSDFFRGWPVRDYGAVLPASDSSSSGFTKITRFVDGVVDEFAAMESGGAYRPDADEENIDEPTTSFIPLIQAALLLCTFGCASVFSRLWTSKDFASLVKVNEYLSDKRKEVEATIRFTILALFMISYLPLQVMSVILMYHKRGTFEAVGMALFNLVLVFFDDWIASSTSHPWLAVGISHTLGASLLYFVFIRCSFKGTSYRAAYIALYATLIYQAGWIALGVALNLCWGIATTIVVLGLLLFVRAVALAQDFKHLDKDPVSGDKAAERERRKERSNWNWLYFWSVLAFVAGALTFLYLVRSTMNSCSNSCNVMGVVSSILIAVAVAFVAPFFKTLIGFLLGLFAFKPSEY